MVSMVNPRMTSVSQPVDVAVMAPFKRILAGDYYSRLGYRVDGD